MTVRLMHKTDLSFAFAYLRAMDPARYHLFEGAGDGTAAVEVPNSSLPTPGPYFVNAGSQYYDLSVLSASIVQHF